tara:strand:+ start:1075 stop:2727 length:1653 start_codon:yes stop_codon:yes gene_type:complete
MPVVTVYFERLLSMLNGSISREELIDKIPYLSLDIEEITDDYIRIEYNPNRPDFSTDYGLARALNSFLQFESKFDSYDVKESNVSVTVDKSTSKVRPYIVAALVKNINLDDESIRQIINMQEDLHNGIGRKRRKVSIGIHNFDVIKPPIYYKTVSENFSFVTLNNVKSSTIREILDNTDVGKSYGHIISGNSIYPILVDSADGVLSFPPIINGDLTRLTNETSNLFIDITGTDFNAVNNALSVLFTTLADAGGQVYSVKVNYSDQVFVTPKINPSKLPLDLSYTTSLLGLEISEKEAINYLQRCRMNSIIENNIVMVEPPPYRFDLIHPVDLVEEIAIGYGVDNITPTVPSTDLAGKPNSKQRIISAVKEVLIGLGLIEIMTFGLISNDHLMKSNMEDEQIKVIETKSIEHEILKKSNIPSILYTLSRNIHNSYPQRIFEVAKIFKKSESLIIEPYHVTVALAHAEVNFTEGKSFLTALGQQLFNRQFTTRRIDNAVFLNGRSAEILDSDKTNIGVIGEVHPEVLENFSIRTPVVLFDINLEKLIKSEIT